MRQAREGELAFVGAFVDLLPDSYNKGRESDSGDKSDIYQGKFGQYARQRCMVRQGELYEYQEYKARYDAADFMEEPYVD